LITTARYCDLLSFPLADHRTKKAKSPCPGSAPGLCLLENLLSTGLCAGITENPSCPPSTGCKGSAPRDAAQGPASAGEFSPLPVPRSLALHWPITKPVSIPASIPGHRRRYPRCCRRSRSPGRSKALTFLCRLIITISRIQW